MSDRREMQPPDPLSKKPEDCTHTGFHAKVEVDRLEDSGRYSASIVITCVECGSPFRFMGVPAGLSFERPACSIDGLELRAPIEPEGEKRLHDTATFQMPEIPRRH